MDILNSVNPVGVGIGVGALALFFLVLFLRKKKGGDNLTAAAPPLEKEPKKEEEKPKGIVPKLKGKYPVLVLKRGALTDSLEVMRIDEPMGSVFWLQPSMPESGQAYFIREKIDGSFEPYDPRNDPIHSDKSPQIAYAATHWERVEGVFVYPIATWQEIGKAIVYVAVAIMFIVLLMKFGG